jgi:Luciferase-like monooxygenase
LIWPRARVAERPTRWHRPSAPLFRCRRCQPKPSPRAARVPDAPALPGHCASRAPLARLASRNCSPAASSDDGAHPVSSARRWETGGITGQREQLGFYTLPGAPRSPRELLDEVVDGERLGLGWVFISERLNIKAAATLSGVVGAVSRRLQIATAATNHNTRHTLVTAAYATTMHRLTWAASLSASGGASSCGGRSGSHRSPPRRWRTSPG